MNIAAPYRFVDHLRLPRLLNHMLFRNSVSILMYHGITGTRLPVSDSCFITDTSFREQITYLRNHFHLTSLANAVELLATGSIREPTAVITFDDGFIGTYNFAFPILKENETPATIFLPTKYIDSDDTIWFCRLNLAIKATAESHLAWRGKTFRIDDRNRKETVARLLQGALKNMPHDDLTAEVEHIIRTLAVQTGSIKGPSPFKILSSVQISEMQESGLIEFGAHTHSHSILSLLTAEKQEEEIALSKEEVERVTKRPCRFFSYPNGRRQDYDDTTIHLLKSAGIVAAVTTVQGPNRKDTPLLELKRYMGGDMDQPSFSAAVHHFAWSGKQIFSGLFQEKCNARE